MNFTFFLVSTFYIAITGFIPFPFGPAFRISDREINKKINYQITEKHQEIINKIDGFYGLIGPDVNMKNITNIFDLFTGDGVIQGVFFDNGEVTFVRHFIRTEKLVYEEQNGKVPNHNIFKLIFGIFNKFGALPDLLGLANTALIRIKNKTYALFERDVPYEIDIDFNNNVVNTLRKVPIKFTQHISAHSKYNPTTKRIETIEYDIPTNDVSYVELTTEFKILSARRIRMNYLPILHDFGSTQKSIILFDSPLKIEVKKLITMPMPLALDGKKSSIVHLVNKDTGKDKKYYIGEGVYIFHYAKCRENVTHVDIFATQYDTLDFSNININGKYRQLSIHKQTGKVSNIKTPDLESLNLEFPIPYENKTIFRSLEDSINNGFVICQDLNIVKCIRFENRFICGEPAIKLIDDVSYLIALGMDTEIEFQSYIIIINLENYEEIEIPLFEKTMLGFHSIFINRS